MTITREQAIDIARPYAKSIGMVPYTNDPMWAPHDWVIAAIIEASQPIADVQAEPELVGYMNRRAMVPEDGQTGRARSWICSELNAYYNTPVYAMADATVAHRQQQAAAKGGE